VGGYFILLITARSGYSNISGISEPPVPSMSKTLKIRPITIFGDLGPTNIGAQWPTFQKKTY
jgi:hypothetical protein